MLRRRSALRWVVALLMVAAHPLVTPAQQEQLFTRQADVIYGRKYGTALTMDVFTPKQNANGSAAILVISGGWSSEHEFPPNSAFAGELLKRLAGLEPRMAITRLPGMLDIYFRARLVPQWIKAGWRHVSKAEPRPPWGNPKYDPI